MPRKILKLCFAMNMQQAWGHSWKKHWVLFKMGTFLLHYTSMQLYRELVLAMSHVAQVSMMFASACISSSLMPNQETNHPTLSTSTPLSCHKLLCTQLSMLSTSFRIGWVLKNSNHCCCYNQCSEGLWELLIHSVMLILHFSNSREVLKIRSFQNLNEW